MEIGEASLSSTSAPARPPAPGPGRIKVRVNHRSICWDTTTSTAPVAHENATVTLRPTAGGPTRTDTTDAEGRVEFDDVPVGSYQVQASAPNYRGMSSTETVTKDATTQVTLELELSGPGVVCSRRHTPRPSNAPTITAEPELFWHGSMMIWIREVAWLLFLALMVVFLVVTIVDFAITGAINPVLGGFCLPALCYGVVAYLSAIIFGEISGYVLIISAGLVWLALTVMQIALMAGATIGPLAVNVAWFPPLCAMWLVFLLALAIGRQPYSVFNLTIPIAMLIVGLIIAVPLYFVLVDLVNPVFWADAGQAALVSIVVILVSAIASLVGGFAGHVFVNDGNLESFNPDPPRLALPYAGERYCVQGNRGWFSHYDSRGETLCYDFAVPAGTHVLAIEEGHVIDFREDRHGSEFDGSGNTTPNHVYVEHRDGTVARYLHLEPGGVSAVNPVLVANSTSVGPGRYRSDVHVHAGQVLARAGSTGVSRFPHIHLGLYRGTTGVGFLFKDASVQRHGGRCYTFRKYLSENPDNGPVTI